MTSCTMEDYAHRMCPVHNNITRKVIVSFVLSSNCVVSVCSTISSESFRLLSHLDTIYCLCHSE